MSVVDQSPREGLIWSGATGARLRQWPNDLRCAHLILTGSYDRVELPGPDVLLGWQRTAREWGYLSMRTSALPTPVADSLAAVGFATVQHLVLLSAAHGDRTSFDMPRDATPRAVLRRSLTTGSSTTGAILSVDSSAFDRPWQLDEGAFHDALRATATARVFVSRRDRRIDGFVLAGVTERTGFIQRLAVHPASRRSGTATRLVARALEWTEKKRCTTTVVNTETSNHAALGLYRSLGFREHTDSLVVMECDLT